MNYQPFSSHDYRSDPLRSADDEFLQAPADAPDSFLENLIHQKSKLLKTKLEVLAIEIFSRLEIASQNLARLEDDRVKCDKILLSIGRAANYLLREHKEKGALYKILFDIEREKRQERIECWRDIVMVMRDFLTAWEAHEQSRGRAIFLENARP